MLRTALVTAAFALLALPAAAFDDAAHHDAALHDAALHEHAFDDAAFEHEGLLAQQHGKHGRHKRLSPEERRRLEDEVQRKMHTYVTVELSSRLGLDDKTALQLADIIRAHREQQHAAHEKVRAESDALEKLLKEGANEAALKKQTAVVLAAAAARPHLEDLVRASAKILTTEQQAKLVLAFPDVMRDVRRMMRKARHGGPGKR